MVILIALGLVALAGATATIHAIARDGYGPVLHRNDPRAAAWRR